MIDKIKTWIITHKSLLLTLLIFFTAYQAVWLLDHGKALVVRTSSTNGFTSFTMADSARVVAILKDWKNKEAVEHPSFLESLFAKPKTEIPGSDPVPATTPLLEIARTDILNDFLFIPLYTLLFYLLLTRALHVWSSGFITFLIESAMPGRAVMEGRLAKKTKRLSCIAACTLAGADALENSLVLYELHSGQPFLNGLIIFFATLKFLIVGLGALIILFFLIYYLISNVLLNPRKFVKHMLSQFGHITKTV